MKKVQRGQWHNEEEKVKKGGSDGQKKWPNITAEKGNVAIPHVELKYVGLCEGGSESAMPTCLDKQIVRLSVPQHKSLIIHDVRGKNLYACESVHAWMSCLHGSVNADEKHVNNKWWCVNGTREKHLSWERKTWQSKKTTLQTNKEWWQVKEDKGMHVNNTWGW